MKSKAVMITMYICMACIALSAFAWMGLSAMHWVRKKDEGEYATMS